MSLAELPIQPPFPPMEAKNVAKIPQGDGWQYEPKWDGFRCLAFRSGDTVELQSKSSQSLTRYFPEVVEFLQSLRPATFVLDGELIVVVDDKLSFDDLLQRIHPAESRVTKLAHERPAQFVVFDLLVDAQNHSLVEQPFAKRRAGLEAFAARYLTDHSRAAMSPASTDPAEARKWLSSMKGQLDGVVAKRLDLPYISGERAMQKIKNRRTVDCVVGGFRYLSKEPVVGSLLLGLYDTKGLLHHVGYTSSIAVEEREPLTRKLKKLIEPPGFSGHAPGGKSRWNSERSGEWEPLRPELVVEVQYDHFTGARFRHGTKFLRWRPDKAPTQCLMDQVRGRTHSPMRLLA